MRGSSMWAALLCATVAIGCGGPEIEDFDCYCDGQPGTGLPLGGEALLETVRVSPFLSDGDSTVATRFYAFLASLRDEAVRPADAGCSPYAARIAYPNYDIPSTTRYADFGDSIALSGPGLGEIEVPRVVAGTEGLADNRSRPTARHHVDSWIYGGPTWQADALGGLQVEPGAVYELGEGLGTRLSIRTPPAYDLPLDIGREEVLIPAGASADGWRLTWEAMPRLDPDDRAYDVAWVELQAFPEDGELAPTPLYRCYPEAGTDGELVIPAEVIRTLPAFGVIVAGRSTTFRDALEDADSELRMFELNADYVGVSVYTK